MTWDDYFKEIAQVVAKKSKDPSRQVGAVIVSRDHQILATGFNGFPRGVHDVISERYERPAKYTWTEHAERNAIYHAARKGVGLWDSVLYTTLFPCAGCARGVIQAGVSEIVSPHADLTDPVWGKEWRDTYSMLREAQVIIRGW